MVADYQTKQLCKRIKPGQVAVLHHPDVDEIAADSLLEKRVQVVINTCPFLTGSYPAVGAKRLWEAGIPLFEVAESETEHLFQYPDDQKVLIADNTLYVQSGQGWSRVARLIPITATMIEQKWSQAGQQLDVMLSQFIDNTLMYAHREKDLFLKPLPPLPLRTQIMNRHVVVVVRGKHYREDLKMLSPYIRECRPVLLAVDGGADVLLEFGYKPDLVIGDMDSISDEGLTCGAEVVVHSFPDGRAPGKKRVEQLGVPYHLLPAPGTSEDVAMLLAYEQHARLIVTIGTHTNMIDFLEKGRKGMSSTLLVRTKIGPRLVDAKGVSQLYQPRLGWNTWLLLGAASMVPISAIFFIHPVTRHVIQMMWKQVKMFTF